MKPPADVHERIDRVGRALAQALGEATVCIAVYGSAAGDDYSPGHSDVNLLVVLREVTFADLRTIGATLKREATRDLVLATPLVVQRSFLRDARDSFPMELADIAERHRVLAGEDVLVGIAVTPDRLRAQAEREARTQLLRLRAIVVHAPPEAEVRNALSALASSFAHIERALVEAPPGHLRGSALCDEVQRRHGVTLAALARLDAIREGTTPWPSGAGLDDLLGAVLRDVEALVAFVDAHAS
ncbi:MAG: hypothetical protein FJ144_19840 [Deltaproteobacteria bacterium]|nr:hypothetical protein [Deltaproteobacteria bacterium]